MSCDDHLSDNPTAFVSGALMPDTSPTPVDGERLHQLVGLAYVPAVKAINAAMDELELTYTAKKPIQGEASNKVLAYRVAVATVETLLAARAAVGPDSERIRELEAAPRWLTPRRAAALDAAGLLLGPDKVAVDREALRHVAEKSIEPSACHLCAEIAAALSEPQPKPEGTS